MLKESPCIKVPKKDGENTLALVRKLGIYDKTLQIVKTLKQDTLYSLNAKSQRIVNCLVSRQNCPSYS